MVKTHKNSRFSLLTLADIRDSKDVILQIEDTASQFTNGGKCYLCEVVSEYAFNVTRSESDLIKEICELNREKRKLESKNEKLEKKLLKCNAKIFDYEHGEAGK